MWDEAFIEFVWQWSFTALKPSQPKVLQSWKLLPYSIDYYMASSQTNLDRSVHQHLNKNCMPNVCENYGLYTGHVQCLDSRLEFELIQESLLSKKFIKIGQILNSCWDSRVTCRQLWDSKHTGLVSKMLCCMLPNEWVCYFEPPIYTLPTILVW